MRNTLWTMIVGTAVFLGGCSQGNEPLGETAEDAGTTTGNDAGRTGLDAGTIVDDGHDAGGPVGPESWRATATQYRGQDGRQVDYACSPDGIEQAIWGTDVYTDDSSVCTAGVHAGLITFEQGGSVTIVIMGRQESFDASTRNGVSSRSWGPWSGSFSFVTDGTGVRR